MALSADQFAEIISGIGASPIHGAFEDKRRAPRASHRARITVIPLSNGGARTPLAVQVLNVSARGIGFTHTSSIAQGSEILVCFPRQGEAPVAIFSSVVRCQQVGRGNFMLGAEFICVAGTRPPAPDPSEQARIQASLLSRN